MPGATATLSREQDPSFCWLWMGRSLELHLLNFLTSAQKPTLEAPRHSTHTPSLGVTFTCTGGHGVTPAKIPGPDSLTQQFSTKNSAGHTPTCTRCPSMGLLTAKLWNYPEVHGPSVMCMCAYVFVRINVHTHVYYLCVS